MELWFIVIVRTLCIYDKETMNKINKKGVLSYLANTRKIMVYLNPGGMLFS